MNLFNNFYDSFLNLYNKIVNYTIKTMYYYPGEGEIFKVKNRCYIKYPEGNIRLNYIKLPDIDNTVGLFYSAGTSDIDIEYSISEFKNKFGEEDIYLLQKYSTGIIDDVYHTKNIKKGDVYGFIKTPLEDNVYIFKLEEGIIDFEKVFKEYKNYMEI